jgi:aspartyl protease family protein
MIATVHGRRIDVLADTGASKLALTHDDARRLGLRPGPGDYTVRVHTANGVTSAAPVTLREVRIGTIRVRQVEALVTRPGDLSINLLGMSFLGELSQFSMRGGELVMVQ